MSKITLLKQCVNLFAKRPSATGVMRTLPSGTRIQKLNKCNYIEKTVFKANGNTITSSIAKDGSFVSILRN